MKGLRYTAVLLCLLAFQHTSVLAQRIEAKAVIDSTNVLIGDQLNLRLEVLQHKDASVEFPQIGDSLSATIEVIERSLLDTFHLDAEEQIRIIQNLTITSFDTGEQVVPSLKFLLNFNNLTDTLESLPTRFFVHGMAIDTTKGPVDIKIPYQAPVTLSEVYPYILGAIIIGALLFFLFYYIQRKKKNKPIFSKPEKPKEPPHIIAIRELDHIKEQELWQHNQIKPFYSKVSDTLRIYIEDRFNIQSMECTTDETLQAFSKQKDLLSKKSFEELKEILTLSDLVKFAKYIPQPDDHNMTLMNAYFFVNNTKLDEKKLEKPTDEREGEEVTYK